MQLSCAAEFESVELSECWDSSEKKELSSFFPEDGISLQCSDFGKVPFFFILVAKRYNFLGIQFFRFVPFLDQKTGLPNGYGPTISHTFFFQTTRKRKSPLHLTWKTESASG